MKLESVELQQHGVAAIGNPAWPRACPQVGRYIAVTPLDSQASQNAGARMPPASVAVLHKDIPDRKHAAQAFESSLQREREANALLDALSQSAPVGLAFLDSELRFQRINSRPATMNGLSPEAHIGKRPDELLESDRDRTREAGFDAHLVKPVSWEELVRVLERAADA